jgi:hypothetical protein
VHGPDPGLLPAVVLRIIDHGEGNDRRLKTGDKHRHPRPSQRPPSFASHSQQRDAIHLHQQSKFALVVGGWTLACPLITSNISLQHHGAVAPPDLTKRNWYTVAEVAARFGKTPQAVRVAADNNRLSHDVVAHGKRVERRFPQSVIDRLARWPGYGALPIGSTVDGILRGEVERQRAEIASLRCEAQEAAAGRAAAEMKIDELNRKVSRQQQVLRALVEALTDNIGEAELRELLHRGLISSPDRGPEKES